MRRVLILCLVLAVALALVLGSTSVVLAGQPGQSCQDQPSSPGHASSSPGSPFNEVSSVAGSHYAGTQPQNSKNPKSVSQYDVACFQVSNH